MSGLKKGTPSLNKSAFFSTFFLVSSRSTRVKTEILDLVLKHETERKKFSISSRSMRLKGRNSRSRLEAWDWKEEILDLVSRVEIGISSCPHWICVSFFCDLQNILWECIALHCLVMCSILVNVQKCFLFKRFSTLNAEEGTHLVPRSNIPISNPGNFLIFHFLQSNLRSLWAKNLRGSFWTHCSGLKRSLWGWKEPLRYIIVAKITP